MDEAENAADAEDVRQAREEVARGEGVDWDDVKEEMRFTPELGQALFGAPWGEYGASNLLIAALRDIDTEIERIESNAGRYYESPFANTGGRWSNGTFSVRAYYWGDDEAELAAPNFKCGDIEVRWYKWLGRSTTVNRLVTPQEVGHLLDTCLKSLDSCDERERAENEPPLV